MTPLERAAKPWEHPDFDDNPEWTEDDFARAKPASEVHGAKIAAAMVRKPGRPANLKRTDAD